MYSNEILVKNIKEKAREQGRTVKSILQECNINICYISQLKGEQGISGAYLYRIADALNCTTDELLGR